MPQKGFIGMPKQQPFKKQPILPIAWPRIIEGAIRSAKTQKEILRIFENISPVIIPPNMPPCMERPPCHTLNIDKGSPKKLFSSKKRM